MNHSLVAVHLPFTKSVRLVQPSDNPSLAQLNNPVNHSFTAVNLVDTKSLRLVHPSTAKSAPNVSLSTTQFLTSVNALETNVDKVHEPSSPAPASDPQVNRPTTHSFAALKASLTNVESLNGSSGFPQPNRPWIQAIALSIGAYIISINPPSPTKPFHACCNAATGSVNNPCNHVIVLSIGVYRTS